MTEARAAAARPRTRRPTETAVRLDRPRQRNVDHLQAQQDADRRIETARRAYVALEQQIQHIHTAAQRHQPDPSAAGHRGVANEPHRSHRATDLRAAGDTPGRHLATTVRRADRCRARHRQQTLPPHQPTRSPTAPCPSPRPAGHAVRQQRILSWVDAHQHDTDRRVIPAITHRGSRCSGVQQSGVRQAR